MTKFELTEEARTIGFEEHYQLSPVKSISDTLPRRRLFNRRAESDNNALRRIIEQTASLRVSFGWSFENSSQFSSMMLECIDLSLEHHAIGMNSVISDMTCSWFGFKPYNVFERSVFEDLSTQGLIIFNNELVDYQIDTISRIQQHPLFLWHSILRNELYRFNFFKTIRKNPDDLKDSFRYMVSAINNVTGTDAIPVSVIEELIGCHYLHHPDVFFESLNFYLLSGKLYNE